MDQIKKNQIITTRKNCCRFLWIEDLVTEEGLKHGGTIAGWSVCQDAAIVAIDTVYIYIIEYG